MDFEKLLHGFAMMNHVRNLRGDRGRAYASTNGMRGSFKMSLERCANGQNFSSGTVKFSRTLRAREIQYILDLPHRSHSKQFSETNVFQARGHASRHIIHVTAACKSVGHSIDQCRTAAFARPGSAYCPQFRINL